MALISSHEDGRDSSLTLPGRIRLLLREPWLRSFRAQLYAGFAGIALLTLFATGFALYLFNKFGEVVNTTAQQAIPELMAVMRISESSALLAAVAPLLAAASSDADLREAETRVNTLVDEINLNSEQLGRVQRKGSSIAVERNSEMLLATLADLKDATQQRLSLGGRRVAGLAELRKVQGNLADIVNPVVYGTTSLVNLLARRGGRRNAVAVERLVEDDAALLSALLETQSDAYRIASVAAIGGNQKQATEPRGLHERCRAAGESLTSRLDRLEQLVEGSRLSELLSRGRDLSAHVRCDIWPLSGETARYHEFLTRLHGFAELASDAVARQREQLRTSYEDAVLRIRSTPQFLASDALRDFRYSMDMKAEANLLIGLLTTVAYADDRHTVTNLYNRYRGSLSVFGKAVEVFADSELAQRNPVLAGQVKALEVRLSAFATESDTLFNIRLEELAVSEEIGALLATHRDQAGMLTGNASRLVAVVEADVSALRSDMARRQVTAVSILVAVWFGSLAIATLIAYFTIQVLSRHEADLRAAKNTAEMINQELEAFNYSVSHDLRAPLRTLSGFSQALLEDYRDKLDGDGRDYLNYLQEGSHEMGELIDGLLKLSRSTRGDISFEEVDLSEMARAVAAQLRAAHPDRQVSFEWLPTPTACADRRLLRVVLDNLIGNAWKYTGMQRHPHIVFGAMEENGETVYFLRDNGVGFDMEYADQLFQPFQRLHRSGDFQGTGIGLATVQRIVRRHGGRIWARARPMQGATFYFTLEPIGTHA